MAKFKVTEGNVWDSEGKRVPVGSVIEVTKEQAQNLYNKGFIVEEKAKELVVNPKADKPAKSKGKS